jgi:hypothetical protein
MSIQEAVRYYVYNTIPARPVVAVAAVDDVDGYPADAVVYETQYTCWPPPMGMVIISIVEVQQAS